MYQSACRLVRLFGPACPRAVRSVLIPVALFWSIADDSGTRAGEVEAANGYAVQWDTTLRYSAGVRTSAPDRALIANPNADDGDRDFSHGVMSNRLDFTTVLDVSRGDFGIQAGADGWLDTVYLARTRNNSPATWNAVSVPNTEFPPDTRKLEGEYIELGDAFAYANFAIAGVPASVRIGRQTVLWGESVFFDSDSIAAAQSPVDYLRTIGPLNYSTTVFLPAGKLFASIQPFPNLTLAAYYQFEWRASRLPGVGSYFSSTDVLGAGAERLLLDGGQFLLRTGDRRPSGSGNFGISLRATVEDTDFGFYALRYASEYPYLRFEFYPAPIRDGEAGEYYAAYPGGIDLYGASVSGYLGNSTIAGEIAARRNVPLLGGSAVQQYYSFRAGTTAAASYARGDTLHAQITAISTFAPGPLWDSANLSAQIGSTWLLDVTQNRAALDLYRQRFVSSVRVLMEPHYFEVLPGLDLSLPLGLGYGLAGQSNLYFGPVAGAGDFEMGVSGTYRSVWKADLIFTGFIGAPSKQVLADRDFLMFSIERSF